MGQFDLSTEIFSFGRCIIEMFHLFLSSMEFLMLKLFQQSSLV